MASPTQEVDMVAAPVTSEHHRERVCDFVTHPYYVEPVTILYQKPKENVYSVYIHPFKVAVWLVLLGVFFIVAIAVWSMQLWVQAKMKAAGTHTDFTEALFDTYTSLFGQSMTYTK